MWTLAPFNAMSCTANVIGKRSGEYVSSSKTRILFFIESISIRPVHTFPGLLDIVQIEQFIITLPSAFWGLAVVMVVAVPVAVPDGVRCLNMLLMLYVLVDVDVEVDVAFALCCC